MKSLSMSGSLRENVGKKDAKYWRKQSMVPCVLYGGKTQVHFVLDEKAFKKAIFTPNIYQIHLAIDGKKYDTILQDVQYHPVSDNVLHADFLEIIPDKPILMSVPLKFTGNSEGVLKGGKLVKKLRKVKIKALVADMPDDIMIDISPIDINQSIKVAHLKRDKMTFLDPESTVIVAVVPTRATETTPGQPEGK